MSDNPVLWEILVPTEMDRGQGIVPIKTRYHKVWDEKIREISNGLTILKPAKGQWVSPSGELFAERMIPVRVMATEQQMDAIVKITLDHYNQEAVMIYVVSNNVQIIHRNTNVNN